MEKSILFLTFILIFKNPLMKGKIKNFEYWSNQDNFFSIYAIMWHEKVINLVQRKKQRDNPNLNVVGNRDRG